VPPVQPGPGRSGPFRTAGLRWWRGGGAAAAPPWPGGLLDAYGVSEPHREELLALARESARARALVVDEAAMVSFPTGYAAFVDAEAAAIRRWDWEPQVVPGLLRTESYAREVMRGWYSMSTCRPPNSNPASRPGSRESRCSTATSRWTSPWSSMNR
jgi:hypothetical protein